MNQKILSRLSAVCACGFVVLAAGCSPEWIAGEAPDTPPGAFKADPVVPEVKGATSADFADAQLSSLPPPAPGPGLTPAGSTYEIPTMVLKDSPSQVPVQPVKKTSASAASTLTPVSSTTVNNQNDIKYVVQVNDTLSGIAYIYGISVDDLAAYNGLTSKSTIKPKQVLYIPSDKLSDKDAKTVDQLKASGFQPLDKAPAKAAAVTAAAAAAGTAAAASASGNNVTYTTVAGDSLGKIGQKFHVSYIKIAKVNNMDPNAKLPIGKTLIIPEPKTVPPAAAAPAKTGKTSASATATAVTAATAATAATVTAAKTEGKSASEPAMREPADEAKKAKSSEPADADIFGDESATSADAPAAAPSAREAAPEKSGAAVQQGPVDPPEIFQYNLTSESSLKSICNSMHYREETVLKLNPGITIDERLGAGRSVTLPMIPDDL